MSREGQERTKAAYEDPQIVAGYVERHAKQPVMNEVIDDFAKNIPGKRVLDLGCGPGQDAYYFTKLGFQVTGIDYSEEMIRTAKKLQVSSEPPRFLVGDMRSIDKLFPENSFDAVWVSASLLHVPKSDVPKVLDGVRRITVDKGKVFIGVKGGEQEEQLIKEFKYGKPMEREFIFWEKDKLEALLMKNGFGIDKIIEYFGKEKTSNHWLNFFLTANK